MEGGWDGGRFADSSISDAIKSPNTDFNRPNNVVITGLDLPVSRIMAKLGDQ